MSWFFALLPLILIWQYGVLVGSAATFAFFIAALLHEVSHLIVARRSEMDGSLVVLWPLGGLEPFEEGVVPERQIPVSLAGPLVNLIICAVTLPAVLMTEFSQSVWNPLVFPVITITERGLSDGMVLFFWVNWVIFLVNLIPCGPTDVNRCIRSILTARMGSMATSEMLLRIGTIVAVSMGVIAVILKSLPLLFLAFLFLMFNWVQVPRQMSQSEQDESTEDNLFGYDFSQGYTSLEKSNPGANQQTKRKGMFERWREHREKQRREREEFEERTIERQLDGILEKLHDNGMNSLSASEKKLLSRASARFRAKGKGSN